ncbi:hypothetical protein SISNIDRAFT_464000 [Sistotremastrum niveocremeum HHB9708]|uniref:DUF6533 domain-containing protein n=1 Tax=Sistotremastrum niveocremeum HHB9708 TaxID=1314777 RepID=A0A164Y305_9AGAM|nr:hypothetical protein SISNIDRAFT_464000 [Sistotremastrum niveocremeum HHB9708]
MSSIQAELDLLFTAVRYSRIVAEVSIAGYVMLIWEYFLTLPKEVEFVWKARWSFGKILFLLMPIYSGHKVRTPVVLLVMRTAALWERNKIIMASLAACYLIVTGNFSPSSPITRLEADLSPVIPKPLPQLAGCLLEAPKIAIQGIWLAPLALETFIFLLTLARAFQHWRQKLVSNTYLLNILYRDGFLYFLVIFAMNLLNTFIFYYLPLQLGEVTYLFYRAIMSTMASRLLLNVRAALLTQNGSLTSAHPSNRNHSISKTSIPRHHVVHARPVEYLQMSDMPSYYHQQRDAGRLETPKAYMDDWEMQYPSSGENAIRAGESETNTMQCLTSQQRQHIALCFARSDSSSIPVFEYQGLMSGIWLFLRYRQSIIPSM